MINKVLTKKILTKALSNIEAITLKEVIKGTSLNYLGINDVDLYIFTNKIFIDKVITNNLLKIKTTILEIEKKRIRHIYLNNIKRETSLKELTSKNTIGTIDMNSIKKELTNEVSGENDIVSETFEYESSILQKKKVTLVFYNKFLNREYKQTIDISLFSGISKKYKKRGLSNKINSLIKIGYKPTTNDTKEVMTLLELN